MMWFRSIEASRFRQFRNPVFVHDLEPGLNVIAGDNEEGKSTLLQAVRAALFDRYKSSVAHTYQPYAEQVSPRVGLVFEIDGTEYTLNKVFSQRREGEATLEASDGRRWEGPQAEEFVAGLLGFTYAPRGGSKAELQGLAGLLWVEQGRAYEEVTLSNRSRQQLHAVLDAEMGELLGGEHGEALQRRVAELRAGYFDKRDKPRGRYRQLQEKLAELAVVLEQAQLDLHQYESKTDQLEKQQAALKGYRDDRAIEKARKKLHEAQARQARVQALWQQIAAAREKLARVHAERKAARLAWETRMKLVRDQQLAHRAHDEAGFALTQTEHDLTPARIGVENLHAEIAAHKKEKEAKEVQARRARDGEKLSRLTADKEGLESVLGDARAADDARRACQVQRESLKVTGGLLTELQSLDRDLALAEERLRAAATRVDHRLTSSTGVTLGGRRIRGEGSILLSEAAVLEVDGVGSFTIHPGGEDLEALRSQVEKADLGLRERLAELGLKDISEAEKALRRRESLDSEIKQYQARLEALAPKGLSELEDRLPLIASQRQALLGRIPEATELPGDSAELESEIEVLAQAIGRLEADLREQEKVLSRRRDELIRARTAASAAQKHARGLDAAVDEARKAATDEKLADALAAANRNGEIQEQEIAAVERVLESENPEAVVLEVERSEKALHQLSGEVRELEGKIRDLVVELNATGQRGLAEELAQAESEHATVERELSQVEDQALAVDLLHSTLEATLRSAKEAVAQPVMAKLLPYLRQLMPGAEPSISEDMALTGIQRGSSSTPFADLSIGTREQLAVLIRLAYADLLSEKGTPVTVILDDALVNSDDERRDRMKAIFYQAAKKYQILVLTCHLREYRDAGGKFIRLAECKS